MTNIKISLLAVMALSSVVMAEVATTADVESKYANKAKVEATTDLKQNINLGFSSTTGNTKTVNVNAKYDASYTTTGYNSNPLKMAFETTAFVTKNDGVTNNEEFVANLGLEQIIADSWLGYAGVNWLRNPDFKNYDNKSSVGFGVGKELFNDGKQKIVTKLGTAYNVEDFANNQETNKYASLNEFVEYNNQLNNVSKLFVKVGAMQNVEDIKEDYTALAVLGVNFKVGENVNVIIEEEIAYDNTPALGFKKTDSKSIVRLGYSF